MPKYGGTSSGLGRRGGLPTGPAPTIQDDEEQGPPAAPPTSGGGEDDGAPVFYPGEPVPKPNRPQEPGPDQPGGGGGGQEGQCPSGQVWRTDSQGAYGTGKAGCEPEDWRSRNDKDTCLGARPNCGKDYDAWCDFSTASWKCGYIGPGPKSQQGGGGTNLARLVAGGHATYDPKSGLYVNLYGTRGHQCWKETGKDVDGAGIGQEIPCPAGIAGPGTGGGGASGGGGFGGNEAALASMITSLGDTFRQFAGQLQGVGFPALSEGINYYRTLLGKGGRGAMQAAVAPAAEQIAAGTEGTLKSLDQGYIGGGAREQAQIAAKLQGQGDTARLTQGVQPGAASQLIGAGGAAAQLAQAAAGTAAGTYQNLLNLDVSTRLSEAGMALNRELGFADLDLKRDLGFANLDYQYSALAQAGEQFMAGLGVQREGLALQREGQQQSNALGWASLNQSGTQFNRSLREQQRQFAAGMRMQQQQQDQAKMQAVGQSLGQGGGMVASAMASAAAFKEEIGPAIAPEEGLRHILEEAAPALRSWRYLPQLGGRKYDNALVLDLAPRYGMHPSDAMPGGAYVDVAAVLGDLIASVKALHEENEELRAQVAALRQKEAPREP